MMFLVVRDKAEIVKEYFVKKKAISIGSDETSDICIFHKMVSPKHCEILQLDNGKVRVTDLKSTFGVFVNKKRINSADVNFGDTVGIGPFELDFVPSDKNTLKKNNWLSLICISGKLRGKKFMLLKDATKIGRDPSLNDIVVSELEDTLASRRHATITKGPKGFLLSDKRSKNRTKLNRETLGEEEEALLAPNDEIVIGKQVFRIVLLTETKILPPSKIYPLWFGLFKGVLGRINMLLCLAAAVFFAASGYMNIRTILGSPAEFKFTRNASFPQQFETVQNAGFSPYTCAAGGSSRKNILVESTLANLGSLIKKNISSPALPEIAVVTPAGKMYFWQKKSGLRKFSKPDILPASQPAVTDLNMDGSVDVVVNAADSRLYAIDGKNEEILFKSDLLGPMGNSSPFAVRPIAGAPADLITCTQNGLVNFINKPLFNPKLTSEKLEGGISASPVVLPPGGNGKAEIGVVSLRGAFYRFDVKSGKPTGHIDVKELSDMNSVNITATPAVGDLNGDKNPDAVFITNNEYLIALDIKTNSLLWKPFSLETQPLAGFAGNHPSCVLSDIDSDGKLDIVAVSVKGKIYGVKGTTGDVLLQFDSGGQDMMLCTPSLADINKDGINDVFFGTEKGEFYVLNFNSGEKDNPQLFYQKLFNTPLNTSPLIADADGDGFLDVILVSQDGQAAMLSSNVPVFAGYVYWPSFMGSQKRTGFVPDRIRSLFFINISVVFLGTAYILVFLFFAVFRKSKRRISWIG